MLLLKVCSAETGADKLRMHLLRKSLESRPRFLFEGAFWELQNLDPHHMADFEANVR